MADMDFLTGESQVGSWAPWISSRPAASDGACGIQQWETARDALPAPERVHGQIQSRHGPQGFDEEADALGGKIAAQVSGLVALSPC